MSTHAAPRISRRLVTFTAALAVGAMLAGAIAVFAGTGDDPIKRKPLRDQPGEVQASDLPDGEHIWELDTPVRHGSFLIAGPDDYPSPDLGPTTTEERTFEHLGGPGQRGVDAARDAGLFVSPDAMPAGYSATSGGALLSRSGDGSAAIIQAGLSIEGGGYPIEVIAWPPYQYERGDPYPIPAWLGADARVMTTLGTVSGRPAAFVHRRPGIRTQELQQVWIDEGDWVIRVEGYVDEFQKLIRVAESILTNRDDAQ